MQWRPNIEALAHAYSMKWYYYHTKSIPVSSAMQTTISLQYAASCLTVTSHSTTGRTVAVHFRDFVEHRPYWIDHRR